MAFDYKPETVRQMLVTTSEKYPDNNAFALKDNSTGIYFITYKKFLSDVDALAVSMLFLLGLKGKKIGICSKNSYEWCLSYMAVLSGIGVAVPIDKDLNGEEIASILNMGKVEALICDNETAKKLLEAIHLINKRPVLICTEERDKDSIIPIKFLIEKGYSLISQGYTLPEEKEINPHSVAVLLFTSGTTGASKGVMLSNYNLCSDLYSVCDSVEITSEDRSLSVLPMHHTYEAIAFLMMIYKGGCISFCKGYKHLLRAFSDYSPTVFVSVPLLIEKIHARIISAMEKEGKLKKAKLLSVVSAAISNEKRQKIFSDIHTLFGGRLKKIIVGAAALQKNVAEDFEMFGFSLIIGYGLTECSPIVICNSDKHRTPDSIGKPIKDVQVKILSPDENGIGELQVKGPMVMLGYYNNEEETKKVLHDGWLKTGDLGYKDKNGNYHITGRSKNVIVNSNGKNIYPEELEVKLLKSPFVAECIVFASDENIITAEILPELEAIGEKIKKESPDVKDVFVVLNDLINSINKKLPSYKRIKKFIVRNTEFEKTTTKKIKRH